MQHANEPPVVLDREDEAVRDTAARIEAGLDAMLEFHAGPGVTEKPLTEPRYRPELSKYDEPGRRAVARS